MPGASRSKNKTPQSLGNRGVFFILAQTKGLLPLLANPRNFAGFQAASSQMDPGLRPGKHMQGHECASAERVTQVQPAAGEKLPWSPDGVRHRNGASVRRLSTFTGASASLG